MSDIVIEVAGATVVVAPVLTEVEILSQGTVVEVAPNVHDVVIDATPAPVVEVAATGLRGPPGPPGQTDGLAWDAPAGETLHGRRIVRAVGGALFAPSLAVVAHAEQCIGLVTQAGSAGALLRVRTAGRYTDPAWSWSPGAIYCGDEGVLTQTPPAVGWVLKVATAVDATTIDIDIDNPFYRS